ncbi:MAG: methyltransferase domain-containing protein [Gammaproteobacteria bacterium]|nr:methyltransferase domain-containing protein [Gammaproteobacteria bacterium]
MFIISSAAQYRDPKESLRLLLELEQALFFLTGSEACRYGLGLHPKHRHTKYHDFFCNRLSRGETVLDLGCGMGALAYDMGRAGAIVTGIDLNEENINTARRRFSHKNITYIVGDVNGSVPEQTFDTVILSNVLEHLEDRVHFLRSVQQIVKPKRWLIRVPMYERDWRVPLMKELGVDYRLDATHCVEHTRKEFAAELGRAGLKLLDSEHAWGEIWSEVVTE